MKNRSCPPLAIWAAPSMKTRQTWLLMNVCHCHYDIFEQKIGRPKSPDERDGELAEPGHFASDICNGGLGQLLLQGAARPGQGGLQRLQNIAAHRAVLARRRAMERKSSGSSTASYTSSSRMSAAALANIAPPPAPSCERVNPASPSRDSRPRITTALVFTEYARSSDRMGVPSLTAKAVRTCTATAKRVLVGMEKIGFVCACV